MAGAVGCLQGQAEGGELGGAAVTDLSDRIVGSWRMLSWTYEVLDTGEIHDALGKEPKGYIHYLPDGRMMVLVLKHNCQRSREVGRGSFSALAAAAGLSLPAPLSPTPFQGFRECRPDSH